MSIQSSYIREMARVGRINFSNHAFDRIGERSIWIEDVYKAIYEGEEIEIQYIGSNYDIRVLFHQETNDIPEFYVIVATSYPAVEVISVCRFKDECWEWLGKIMKGD